MLVILPTNPFHFTSFIININNFTGHMLTKLTGFGDYYVGATGRAKEDAGEEGRRW